MSDYDVGYAKPPLETRFKKGKSGNPDGRRKGSKNLATMVQEALDEKVVVNMGGRQRKISKLEAAFIQQANKAAGGDQKAVKLMVDLLVGAQLRDAAGDGADDISPEAKRERNQRILAALKARLEHEGGDLGEESK